MIQIMPFIPNIADFTEEISLGGLTYSFRFIWNETGQSWSMSIYNRDSGNLLISGRRLLAGVQIIGRFTDRGLPKGTLFLSHPNPEVLRKEYPRFDAFAPAIGWGLIYGAV